MLANSWYSSHVVVVYLDPSLLKMLSVGTKARGNSVRSSLMIPKISLNSEVEMLAFCERECC